MYRDEGNKQIYRTFNTEWPLGEGRMGEREREFVPLFQNLSETKKYKVNEVCTKSLLSCLSLLLSLQDPHDELKNQNVLIVRGSEESTAEKFKLDTEGVKALLERARERLFQERCKRPPPHLDNKMITAWNGNEELKY